MKNSLGGVLSLHNSVLANSIGGVDCIKSDSTPAIENINNLIKSTGLDLESCGNSLLASDPILGTLQDNGGNTHTMAPDAASPTIDAGDDASCPAADQRGLALNYGLSGDYPVVGDWDGDGDDTIGVYRGNTFLRRNSNRV